METPKEYHYVYYSYEEWGMGYFGSRTCKCLPEEDVKYFGSFKDKTFRPTQKIILKSDYATREEAYADEIILQEYYKVVENPHFANRAYQTSTGFSRKGTVPWNKGIPRDPETIRKMSENSKGKIPWNKGIPRDPKIIKKMNDARKNKPPHNKGKKMSLEQRQKLSLACMGRKMSEEAREKISKATKGRKLTDEHKRKIAEANRGTPKTMTERRKQSDIEKGLRARGKLVGDKNPTKRPEVRKKISDSCRGRVPWNKGISNPDIMGGKNPRARKLCYNDVVFDSIKDAVKLTGKTKYHITKYGNFL